MASINFNDDSAVVIIGSGAGGGTLANELCQKGIKCVVLEAGARQSPQSFVNDEWKSFGQLAWLDPRTTSGTWRVAKDFSGLPAWICKTVGGSTTHWAGASLRLQEHEFRVKTVYGELKGANLLDWPVTLKELEPYYAKAENKMGVTRTNGIPGLPGNKDGKEQRQAARVVCVAGNSIETPRLLLLSDSHMFPDGLANSSGQVGRNYMRHMTGSVYAMFKDPVHMYRGTTMAGIIRDESFFNPRRGFVGGYEMETLSLGLSFMPAFLDPGAWGADYASWFDNYTHMAGMWLVGEDMPRETNRITLNGAVRDKWGSPVANVHFDDHENDIVMRNHAFTQGERVYQAAGATKTYRTPPYPSTHNLGSCRLSANPRDGVANKWGQTHDIPNLFISDGSQFTSGGAENPTLTIVTLAIRQADYIAKQMTERAI